MKRFRKSEKGQGLVEYGLILALVSVVAVAGLKGVGGKVKDTFEQVVDGSGVVVAPEGPEITTEERVETEAIPYQTIVQEKDSSKFTDEIEVLSAGKKGEVKRTYTVTLEDGVEVGKELVSEERVDAVNEVVKTGAMNPTYREYLATDSNFSGTADGEFKYIGNKEIVYIPHKIKGVEVTSYNQMFQGVNDSNVKKVISDNPNVTNMGSMFYNSQATSLDLSSFDTSRVTNMQSMFQNSRATGLDLSSFDTSQVTSMGWMFRDSQAKTLDLSSFDTGNVTDMQSMFRDSQAKSLNLSSFDTSNVTNMYRMFQNSQATSGYARTQADASRFNSSYLKPSGLTFIVK